MSARYRRGSVIRQPAPHLEYPGGARRWSVLGVEGDDYFVRALFSDGSPMYALWDVGLCEDATELEWHDKEIGRIDAAGECLRRSPAEKVTDDRSEQESSAEDPARRDPQNAAEAGCQMAEGAS